MSYYLCEDIMNIIGKELKNIREEQERQFQCERIRDPNCLGFWLLIGGYNSERTRKHYQVLDSIENKRNIILKE